MRKSKGKGEVGPLLQYPEGSMITPTNTCSLTTTNRISQNLIFSVTTIINKRRRRETRKKM